MPHNPINNPYLNYVLFLGISPSAYLQNGSSHRPPLRQTRGGLDRSVNKH